MDALKPTARSTGRQRPRSRAAPVRRSVLLSHFAQFGSGLPSTVGPGSATSAGLSASVACALERRITEHTIATVLDSRIYIADDEPANVTLLEAVLGRAGFTSIASFADGGALLSAIADQEPDLVLLDLQMPIVDGLSVLHSPRSGPHAVNAANALALRGAGGTRNCPSDPCGRHRHRSIRAEPFPRTGPSAD